MCQMVDMCYFKGLFYSNSARTEGMQPGEIVNRLLVN